MTENSTPAPPKAKRAKPAKKALGHPKYTEMITAAIKALNSRPNVSRQAIQAFIKKEYKVGESSNHQVKIGLKRLMHINVIKQIKGIGASGSFRLVKTDEQKKVAKKVVKAPKKTTAARKPVATKKLVKAVTKAKRSKVDKKKPKSPKKKAASVKKVKKAKPAKAKVKAKKTSAKSSGKKSKK